MTKLVSPTSALPVKLSIAVLPFTNLSDDPAQEYFTQGVAEDIIAALSRFTWFLVISRNSSFRYQAAPVDVKQVTRELGVRYILQGSVRKAGNRIRVAAQLIDGEGDHHVWADRYGGRDQRLAAKVYGCTFRLTRGWAACRLRIAAACRANERKKLGYLRVLCPVGAPGSHPPVLWLHDRSVPGASC